MPLSSQRPSSGDSCLTARSLSKELWDHLKASGHIDAKGKVQDPLKLALKNGTLALPPAYEVQRGQIAEVLRKVSGRLEIKNADDRRPVPLRNGADGKAVYLSDDFKALWDRIKHQTTYRVQFDNAKLLQDCIAQLKKAPAIAKTVCSGARPTFPLARPGCWPPRRKAPPRWCWTRPTSSCRTC